MTNLSSSDAFTDFIPSTGGIELDVTLASGAVGIKYDKPGLATEY
jgi:hypothetical protein